ncbi:MAG: LysR family transcriptional regulator [Pigmentiphaga sp.]
MDIRQLQFFLSVFDYGTMGRAARHLRVSQPALSQSLAKLEDQLKVQLFERTSRGMVPTPFGIAFAERARNISTQARLAIEDIDALRGSGRGHLSIGAGPSFASGIVPEAVLRLLVTRPKFQVSIMVGASETLIPAIEHGLIDLLIGSVYERAWDRELASEMISQDTVSVMARKDHPLNSGNHPLQASLAFPWVLAGRNDSLRLRLTALFQEAQLPPPEPRVETSSDTAIKSLLMRSDYLGFLPRALTAVEEAAGLLAPISLVGGHWNRPIHILYLQRKPLSAAARAFVNHVHAICQENAASPGLRTG